MSNDKQNDNIVYKAIANRVRITSVQKDKLVQLVDERFTFLPNQPAPISKNTKSLGTNWQEIAKALNKLGNTKSWQNWIKCFREIKLAVKIKLSEQHNGKEVKFSPSDSKIIYMCHLNDTFNTAKSSIPIKYVKQETELDIRDDHEGDTNRGSLMLNNDNSHVTISSQTNENKSQSACSSNNNIKNRKKVLRVNAAQMYFLLQRKLIRLQKQNLKNQKIIIEQNKQMIKLLETLNYGSEDDSQSD